MWPHVVLSLVQSAVLRAHGAIPHGVPVARANIHLAPVTMPCGSDAFSSVEAMRSPRRHVYMLMATPKPPKVPGRHTSRPCSTWHRKLSRMPCCSLPQLGWSRHRGVTCPSTYHCHPLQYSKLQKNWFLTEHF